MSIPNIVSSISSRQATNDIPTQQLDTEDSQSIRNIDARDNLYVTQENNQHELRSKVEKLIAQGRKVRVNKTVTFNSMKYHTLLFIQKILNFFNENIQLVDNIPDVIDFIEYKSKGKSFDLNGRIDRSGQLKSKLYNFLPSDRQNTLVCYHLSYIVANDMVKITGHSSEKDLANEIITNAPGFISILIKLDKSGRAKLSTDACNYLNGLCSKNKADVKDELEDISEFLKEFTYANKVKQIRNILATEGESFTVLEFVKLAKIFYGIAIQYRMALRQVKTEGELIADTNIYYMKALNVYACSELELPNFLYKICKEVEDSTVPIERSFTVDIEPHVIALKIKKTSRGIKIKLFEPNDTGRFKKIELLSATQAKNLTIFDLFSSPVLSAYKYYGYSCKTKDALRFLITDYTKLAT